jgi:hypothetical protein
MWNRFLLWEKRELERRDIMIPNALSMKEQQIIIFHNELNAEMFEGNDISVFAGPMVTVLGTSLQNRDLLKFS